VSSGHALAREVLPGGTGRALSGHGVYMNEAPARLGVNSPAAGDFVVPNGTSITMPAHNVALPDYFGRLMEAGDWDTIGRFLRNNAFENELSGMTTWLPGARIPRYELLPPDASIKVLQNSISVSADVEMMNILQPNMGNIIWASCTKNFWGR
jgi:hypothetical protein